MGCSAPAKITTTAPMWVGITWQIPTSVTSVAGTISWSAVTGTTDYLLYISDPIPFGTVTINGSPANGYMAITSNSATITVTPGSTFNFSVGSSNLASSASGKITAPGYNGYSYVNGAIDATTYFASSGYALKWIPGSGSQANTILFTNPSNGMTFSVDSEAGGAAQIGSKLYIYPTVIPSILSSLGTYTPPAQEATVPSNLQAAFTLWKQWGYGDANSFMNLYNQGCSTYPDGDWWWIGSSAPSSQRLYFCCNCIYNGAGDAGINALVAAGYGNSPSFVSYVEQLRAAGVT